MEIVLGMEKIASEVVVTIQVLASPTLGINRAQYFATLSVDALVRQPCLPMRIRILGGSLGADTLHQGNTPNIHEIEGT